MKGDGIIKLQGRDFWYTDFRWEGKQIRRSLKTGDKVVAKRRAATIYQHLVDGKFENAEAMKFRGEYATIGKVIEVFKLRAGESVKAKTISGYVSSLRMLLKRGLGVTDPDSLRVTVLTADLVIKYEEAMAAEIKDVASRLRVRTTMRSTLNQARAIFDADKLRWYRKLKLPSLEGFRAQGIQGVGRRAPRPLPTEAIEGIREAAVELKKDNTALYLTFLLFSRLGMRNVEITAARWSWIEQHGAASYMAIVRRPDENFDPKGSEGLVRIEPDVLKELLELKGDDAGEYIVPAANVTMRQHIVNREHSAWAGQWIKDRSKTSYELRRYAGSLVYAKTKDVLKVKEFLRHSDVTTTTRWYAYLLSEAPGLSMSDF